MPHCSHVLALVFTASIGTLMACGGVDDASSAMAATAAPAEVDVAKLKAIMDTQKVALIDVRTAAEFAEGHAPGAVNIPVGELDKRMSELEPHKSADVYLICRSGSRSARAQAQLLAAGFLGPINVVGGTLAWRAAGHPVE